MSFVSFVVKQSLKLALPWRAKTQYSCIRPDFPPTFETLTRVFERGQVQIASPDHLSYDKGMHSLRSKSLGLWMAPLLWTGLLLQSGGWVCGCVEHNPWLLTVAHCVGDWDDHHHPIESVDPPSSVETQPSVESQPSPELDHHHIAGRDLYRSDAKRVDPPADVEVEFLPWHLGDSQALATAGASDAWPSAPPEHSRVSGPLRAQFQVYLL